MFYTPRGSGSWGDTIEFRFSRPMRRLIIRLSGRPVLFIENDRMYFHQWDVVKLASSDAEQHLTYLEINVITQSHGRTSMRPRGS